MKLKFNVTGPKRKELVGIISDTIGQKAVYQFMPTCAYTIGGMTVDKEGTLHCEDCPTEVLNALSAAGFAYEQDEPDVTEPPTAESIPTETTEPMGLTISLSIDKVSVDNLTKLLDAKGSLIRKALGITDTTVTVTDEKVSFPWFAEQPAQEETDAYTKFICALCEMSVKAKRVTAKEKDVGNDKYAFRCFLLRLGFIGDQYKAERKILLKKLSGSSAFKSGAKKGGDAA